MTALAEVSLEIGGGGFLTLHHPYIVHGKDISIGDLMDQKWNRTNGTKDKGPKCSLEINHVFHFYTVYHTFLSLI